MRPGWKWQRPEGLDEYLHEASGLRVLLGDSKWRLMGLKTLKSGPVGWFSVATLGESEDSFQLILERAEKEIRKYTAEAL